MQTDAFMNFFLGLVFAPLLGGIINRTKAAFAGRIGQPLLQPYYDMYKNFRKGAVYSRTTSWLFRAGPIVSLAAVLVALSLVPVNGSTAPLSFTGDLLLFAYAIGLMRFFTVLAALDTGSSFEGMGASREVFFRPLQSLRCCWVWQPWPAGPERCRCRSCLPQRRRHLLSWCWFWPLWV